MKVKVMKTHPDAVLPKKAYPSDYCYDCVAVTEEEVAPDVWKYGLGLAFQVERDFETICESMSCNRGIVKSYPTKIDFSRSPINLSIDVRPRSSVYKTGMVLSNCVGTVDENYTGEVSAVFYHVKKDMPRYRVGDRVVQIKLGTAFPMKFELVDALEDTDRSSGSYGSTGK